MSLTDPQAEEQRLSHRRDTEIDPHHPHSVAAKLAPDAPLPPARPVHRRSRLLARIALSLVILLALATTIGFIVARHWIRSAAVRSLPQLDGTLSVPGLSAQVTVQRDAHGVPHIHAQSVDDLVFAQGFVTTQDRLFQMDTLRRLAAGDLAEILGSSLLDHDKMQRTLQIRASADRALANLPADQLHLLEVYAKGVNASLAQQSTHLPVEFRILGYEPAPWTPRDSILISLVMFQDLTNSYPGKLAREALSAQLSPDLTQDLYPVGSWRDHPPASQAPDLTLPGPPIEQVPLDESQSRLVAPGDWLPAVGKPTAGGEPCADCRPGSNNWVVSGAHTASGKPLLSNDMHLTHSVPGIWYESDLEAPVPGSEPLHVTGVSIPGLPLIVVGHNAHIAWGFTNLGADVQDVYIEKTRGSGADAEFQAPDGSWKPLLHLPETIKVKHGLNVTLDVTATQHGGNITPVLTPLLKGETRQLALNWTLYDPRVVQLPTYAIATAHDWSGFLAAFAQFGGPAQNVVYADDQGHIGYHAVGRVPLRGGPNRAASTDVPSTIASPDAPRTPGVSPTIAADPDPLAATALQAPPTPNAPQLSGPLSPVPLVPTPAHEWTGYIPFDQMPQVYDPSGGIIATANARVTPDDYPYPVTLNWGSSYRTERILHLLARRKGLTPADMLAIETDVYSDFDKVLAERLAYALDHSAALSGNSYKPGATRTLRQAADLLRTWNGRMTTDSAAAAIVATTHNALWPMLLKPHLQPGANPDELYLWYAKDYALEQILMHTPPRWLPTGYSNWNDLLTAAVQQGLTEGKAPGDLAKWRYGSFHTLEIKHPVFAQSAILRRLLGRPTGTGELPQSGDGTTVKQVGHSFGPSERFTADLANLDNSTLNLVLGESGDPMSQWFMGQFPAWYHGTTYKLPFSDLAVDAATTHTLTLTP